MTRQTRLIPAIALASLFLVPVEAQSPQEITDLRRRIEYVEQQMFQQRLAQPPSTQGQAVERLQMRLDQLETRLASERISETSAAVTSRARTTDTAAPASIEARLEVLEKQRAEDAKTIAALMKRIETLEKPRRRR